MSAPAARDPRRLPKWAQDYIAQLERSVEDWKRKADAGPANSDTFLYLGYESDAGVIRRPLGKGEHIHFVLAEGVEVHARIERNYLEITSEAWGFRDVLAIRPWSSNRFHVHVLDRKDS